METTISLNKKTRDKLALIKIKESFESYDQLILTLIKLVKQFQPELKEEKKKNDNTRLS